MQVDWYRPIECDNTVKKPMVTSDDNLAQFGFGEDDFYKGEYIKGWPQDVSFQVNNKKLDVEPDDALQNHLMLPIYSSRLVNILKEENIQGIQFLPIKVLRSNNDVLHGFCIANFTNLVAAFNFDKSIYDRFDDDFPNPFVRGEITGITKFVLNKSPLINKDVIRLKEYPRRFFVSERVKKIFETHSFTGYSFVKIKLS